jgi:hypothetical protein
MLWVVVVVGGIYSPRPPNNHWGRLLSMGAPDSPVPHRTLSGAPATSPNRLGSRAFDRWRLCPLVAPDCSVSGAPLTCGSDSMRTVPHYSSDHRAFVVNRCTNESLLRCHTGQSGGTPDSPVNRSRARLEKPESG